MAHQSPSNPTTYSAELQTFIVSKYDPLLMIIKEMNERVQATDKECWRLEKRVAALEKILEQGHIGIGKNVEETSEDNELDGVEIKRSERRIIYDEDALTSSPWLFSCRVGTALSAIQVLLDFTPERTTALDVRLWNNEEDMWLSLLEDLPEGCLPDGFTYTSTPTLSMLRRSAWKTLLNLCKKEFLLVLRNVPGKLEASSNPTAITLVAIMAAAFSDTWHKLEALCPDDLGRIAVVLEGDSVGKRLRAGEQKFRIEPIN